MNELKVFDHPTFGSIRTVELNGAPWFVGKDVAEVLGYGDTNQAIRKHVDDEDKLTRQFDGSGQKREMTVINESGLYSLILSSKLPGAKEFKRWVTGEVLPSIRKTGGYIHSATELTPEELMAKALMVAQKTLEAAQEKNQLLTAENSRLTVDKQIMQPKADYFDELVDRNLLTSFRDTAKELQIPPKKFTQWLLDHKYIYRDKKGKLMPYEKKNNGLFEVKECFNEKTQWSGAQALVTPKGRETFRLLCTGLG